MMKRILLMIVVFPMVISILLGITTPSVVLSPTFAFFGKQEAVDMVWSKHPDYPKEADAVKEIKIQSGPLGGYMYGTMTVQTQKIARDAYEIKFIKKWNLVFNGVPCTDEFAYQVTRHSVKLLSSVQNADLIHGVK